MRTDPDGGGAPRRLPAALVILTVWVVAVADAERTPARTTRVEPGPPGVVAAAVVAAASGDTLILSPGTYSENGIVVSAETLTILGDGDAASVVLDGGRQETTLPMIWNTTGVNITLQRLTIRGTLLDARHAEVGPGAMTWRNGGHVTLDHCQFVDNEATPWAYTGHVSAGVGIFGSDRLDVIACRFSDNEGGMEGSHLDVTSCNNMQLSRTSFGATRPQLTSVSLLSVITSGAVVIDGCKFDFYDSPKICSGGASLYATGATITGNEFGAGLCNDVLVIQPERARSIDLVLRGNRFWASRDRPSTAWAGFGLGVSGRADVAGNSLAGVQLARGLHGHAAIANNVVTDASLSVIWPDTELSCNVIWNGHVFLGGGVDVDTSSMIHEDPLYCAPFEGDLRVGDGSVCLPENNDGCGKIGWGSEGCEVIPVAPMSWGQVKWRFESGSWARWRETAQPGASVRLRPRSP